MLKKEVDPNILLFNRRNQIGNLVAKMTRYHDLADGTPIIVNLTIIEYGENLRQGMRSCLKAIYGDFARNGCEYEARWLLRMARQNPEEYDDF
jgi:hypothetical protein